MEQVHYFASKCVNCLALMKLDRVLHLPIAACTFIAKTVNPLCGLLMRQNDKCPIFMHAMAVGLLHQIWVTFLIHYASIQKIVIIMGICYYKLETHYHMLSETHISH